MARRSGHGGWRAGAGSRPIPEAERLVPLSIRITRDLIDRLIKLDPSGSKSAAVTAREIVLMALERSDKALSADLNTQFARDEAARMDRESRRVWQVFIESGPMRGHYLVPSQPLLRETSKAALRVGERLLAFDRTANVEYEVEIVDGAQGTVRVLRKIGSLPPVEKVVPMSRREEE